MSLFSITDLPSKEELLAHSEHLALAVEVSFREWLLLEFAARKISPQLLLQFMRISQQMDERKFKKAMLIVREREIALKEAVAADHREYDNKVLSNMDRETTVKEKRLEFQMSKAKTKPSAQSAPKPKPEPTPKPAPEAPYVSSVKTPPALELSTEELVAMEWDLRFRLHFGDLRPFDWFTGLRTIYFPDRSAYPGPPVPNLPDDVPLIGLAARPDGFFILPVPVSELPKDWEKSLLKPSDKPPYTPVPPLTINGQVQWQHLVEPAYPHTEFPYNTVLPAGWALGDPIPGMPEEFA